ncbi:PREDICTED: olfactory receptor 5T1-like [Galeopterus variegatus]|uniref:Olfactory receptor 5T1-like n=1 Tax=Galeopterus variegatus TaxID=482537 RepID=A0ABM0SEF3_GALVR|nr:PREDICTED: olfactory receptor 5T1-like [Galeopterus variegatus]
MSVDSDKRSCHSLPNQIEDRSVRSWAELFFKNHQVNRFYDAGSTLKIYANYFYNSSFNRRHKLQIAKEERTVLDACHSTVVTPKMLINFMAENKSISFLQCAAQMFLFVTLGTTECFLLAAMAYDRYAAIYNPLRYSVSMSPRVYVPLILASYVGGILNVTTHTVATFSLSFCGSNEVRHIFCDIPPLLTISCSDTRTNQLLLFYFVGSIEIVTVLIVLVSYGFILVAILKMHSAKGTQKIFSTCGSHLTGVSIFHGTILFMYVRPSSSYALEHDMRVSIFYTIVIPMLNPIIYSLRNKDVKEAMERWFGKSQF